MTCHWGGGGNNGLWVLVNLMIRSKSWFFKKHFRHLTHWEWLTIAWTASVALIGYLALASYRDVVDQAQLRADTYSNLLTAMMESSLRRAAGDLGEIANDLPLDHLNSRAGPTYTKKVDDNLRMHLDNFGETANFRIVNFKGDNVYSSELSPKPRINISDRRHFIQLRDNPGLDFVISDPIVSRYRHEPTVVLARALRDNSGSFLGAVTTGINFKYFQDVLKTFNLNEHGFASIRHSNSSEILVRWPLLLKANGSPTSQTHPGIAFNTAGDDAISPALPLIVNPEQNGLIHSEKSVKSFPFTISVDLNLDDELQPWLRTILPIFAVAFVLLATLLIYMARMRNISRQAYSKFIAASGHDLLQPLNALTLYTSLLQTQSSVDRLVLLDYIKACVTSLNRQVSTFLDIGKLNSENIQVNRETFNISPLFERLNALYFGLAATKGLTLRFRTSDAVVCCDPFLMRVIAGNFISNAINFTKTGGILVAIRRHAGKRWLEVWDTGIGIAGTNNSVIFEEFTQLGKPAAIRGSGLGLSIVTKLAAQMHLKIRMHSRLGRGSMFAIEIPDGGARVSQPVRVGLPPEKQLRIALVNNDLAVAGALTLALTALGHEVVPATSMNELLDRLKARGPQIVIADLRLANDESGTDVISALRDTFKGRLPAIVLTATIDLELMRRMSENGVAVLFTPIAFETLNNAILDLI